MARLTDKQVWDRLYSKNSNIPKTGKSNYKSILRPYFDRVLLDALFLNYLPRGENAKVFEVGSAPGHFLVLLHDVYGLTPYGVEYSETGVIRNREVFEQQGLDCKNIIHADFFDELLLKRFAGYFDVVVSRGFIEHFSEAECVVARHLEFLRQEGILVISIPNLSRWSIYRMWSNLFDRDLLARHNLNIMSAKVFSDLFEYKGMKTLFCGYFGALSFSQLGGGRTIFGRAVVSILCRVQLLVNIFLNVAFRNNAPETQFLSPMLLYIGRKTES